MDPLATLTDLEMRLGRELTGPEAVQGFTAVHGASATVRSYVGSPISLGTHTQRLPVRRGYITLPVEPVISVTSATDHAGNPVAVEWLGGQRLALHLRGLNDWEVEPRRTAVDAVTVTYVAGLDPVPDELVEVVCQVAGRSLTLPPDQSGVAQESIGQGAYSWSLGGAAASGTLGLMVGERAILDRYRKVVGVSFQ